MSNWKWDRARGSWRKELWISGKRKQLRFKGSKAGALEYEAKRRLQLLAAAGAPVPAMPTTFARFVADTYEAHAMATLRDSTWNVRRYRLKPLIAFFGDTNLTELRTLMVETYKQKRTTGAARVDKVTCNSELNDLSAILKYARHIEVPCAEVKITRLRTRLRKGRARYFTRAEVEFILAGARAVEPSFHALVKFLAETGCRRSEGIGLARDRLALDTGTGMAKIWSDVGTSDGKDERDRYEAKSGDREVPISDGLALVLRAHLETSPARESRWVFPVTSNRASKGGSRLTRGERYAEWPKHLWRRAVANANELARRADPNAREIEGGPHRLRHTYASIFLSVKPDLFALSKVLGHTHSRVTELYAHFLPDHLATTRNIVTYELVGGPCNALT